MLITIIFKLCSTRSIIWIINLKQKSWWKFPNKRIKSYLFWILYFHICLNTKYTFGIQWKKMLFFYRLINHLIKYKFIHNNFNDKFSNDSFANIFNTFFTFTNLWKYPNTRSVKKQMNSSVPFNLYLDEYFKLPTDLFVTRIVYVYETRK